MSNRQADPQSFFRHKEGKDNLPAPASVPDNDYRSAIEKKALFSKCECQIAAAACLRRVSQQFVIFSVEDPCEQARAVGIEHNNC